MFDSFVKELSQEPLWSCLGLLGQFIFGGRFILQWLVSEYKKRSHVPTIFWYMSLAGSLLLLAYSIHRNEPVFILGFSLNTLIYIRNIHLIFKHKKTGEITPIEQDED
ncbi:MAG: lipid-A-disaccharide synthase N-terminal domain-containing protein [Anaerohalosphaeraceae bacterium]|nr:lipid-A-disaccharide synthase N-terminal domain-containing protein [Anaerohalosphaeraceae bacterium]